MSGPTGRSGSDGWFLEGTGSDPASDRDASIHESYHHRLDRSTTFGAIMVAYGGLVKAGVGDGSRLAQMRDTCRTVHESAATYLTSLSLGRLDDRTGLSPHYRRYYDGMDALVGGDDTPAWLRFHVALAVARACMQPNVMAVVDAVGLDGVTASSFRSSSLADERFRRLRSNPTDVAALDAAAADTASLDAEDPRRTGGEMLASWFDPADHDVYVAYEAAAWREIVDRLAAEGCEVDEIDAQLGVSDELLERGRALGAVYDIVADGTERDREGRVWAALGPLDNESIALPARRRAHLVSIDDIDDWVVLARGSTSTNISTCRSDRRAATGTSSGTPARLLGRCVCAAPSKPRRVDRSNTSTSPPPTLHSCPISGQAWWSPPSQSPRSPTPNWGRG